MTFHGENEDYLSVYAHCMCKLLKDCAQIGILHLVFSAFCAAVIAKKEFFDSKTPYCT